MEISKWKREIKIKREQKNMFFAKHIQSPIRFKDRSKFEGLDYYLPNPGYCFD